MFWWNTPLYDMTAWTVRALTDLIKFSSDIYYPIHTQLFFLSNSAHISSHFIISDYGSMNDFYSDTDLSDSPNYSHTITLNIALFIPVQQWCMSYNFAYNSVTIVSNKEIFLHLHPMLCVVAINHRAPVLYCSVGGL